MPKKKTKGPAPNLPAWQVDRMVKQAKKKATDEAVSLSMCLMLTVLLDKYGMEDRIQDVYNDWNKLAEEVLIDHGVKLHEIRNVLREEYKINI